MMPTYTATIELTDDAETLMLRAAAFFKMTTGEFLTRALESGISHAEDLLLSSERPPDADDGDMDDGIPF